MADDEQEFPQPTGLVRIIVPDLSRAEAERVTDLLDLEAFFWVRQEQTPATPEV